MSRQLSSNNSPEHGSPCELIHLTEIDEDIPGFAQDPSKEAPATNWNTAKTPPLPSHNLPGAKAGERITLVSRAGTQQVHRDHQARNNFAAIFHASPAILCIIQLDGLRYCEINKVYEQLTGYSRSEVLGRPCIKLGLWSNAKDRARVFQELLAKGSLQGHQEDFQTKTGELLTTLLSAQIIEFGGEPCALVVVEDITMRRQAEEARLELAQRLINAREMECAHVARELHDNIGQYLALFSVELERARLALIGLSPDSDAALTDLCGRLKHIGRVVGNLSHQLHSSELEFLGLVVAVEGLCREFSEQYHVQVNCVCSGVPDNLSPEIALCLFRVTQEALHNVAKHSQARRINIKVHGTLRTLHLRVSDDGIGIAQNDATTKPGLGIISMRERLHLIGGQFKILSKLGAGTQIEAVIRTRK
jgi:PAS domain S-box-containing protein